MVKDSQDIIELRNNFDKFYNQNLSQIYDEMENVRLKYLKTYKTRFRKSIIILICLAIFAILFFAPAPLMISPVLLGIYTYYPIYNYKNHTKGDFFPTFIKYFGNFNYKHLHHIEEDVLIDSFILPTITSINADDYFEGSYKGVNIVVSELLITTGSGKDSTTHPRLCVLLSMNKSFNGQTFALQDKGFMNKFEYQSGFDNIKLEDPVFEKEWEIYSDNQVEARYLLTTAFMERVLKVKDMYKGRSIQFSFFENNLLLAIDNDKDMFEAGSLFKSSDDKTHIYQALEQILSVLSIVELLKLNQKIGM